jgi:hypothetical protein
VTPPWSVADRLSPLLFAGLFDDAALFPPGDAPMTAAVPAHRALRARLGALTGPFVVPAARLDELAVQLEDGPPIEVAVIVPADGLAAAVERVAGIPGLRLAAVELTPAPDGVAARTAVAALRDALPAGVPAALEVPRSAARDSVLDVLAGTGHRAKVRTGGLRYDLFPAPGELARTLHACLVRGVPFKCTAGLHHAVRRTDPASGFDHHGFLNVVLAVDALLRGGTAGDAAALLDRRDTAAVVREVRALSRERAAAVRAVFTSFGTCSVTEPYDDLVALGLLEPAGTAA